jgi:hypothetical protein
MFNGFTTFRVKDQANKGQYIDKKTAVLQTNNGIKINMRDQDAAVANLARYLGMMVDKKEISGPGGGPLAFAHLTAEDLSDDQLAAILKADDATDEA